MPNSHVLHFSYDPSDTYFLLFQIKKNHYMDLSGTLPTLRRICTLLQAQRDENRLSISSFYLIQVLLYGGSDGKVSAYNAGDLGSIPGSGRSPWRRKWQPTPVHLPGESHGWGNLVGYSPWGHRVGHN